MCEHSERTTQLATSLRRWGSQCGFNVPRTRVPKAALWAGVASVFILAMPTHAQQAAETEAEQIEEITVTGTRIRTPGLISNSPVTSLDADEMQYRQPVAAEELIKQLPVAVPAIGPGTNNGANGLATIDLRGLGPERTLVLIDGRRIVPGNLDGAVDTNAIPVSLLERVDLLTGGASVLYGADAVAGVVNFILKKDFEGVDLSASYASSGEGDSERFRADLTLGTNTSDGRGNITMSFGYTERDPLLQGQRPFGLESIDSSTGAAVGSSAAVPTVTILAGALAAFDPGLGAFRQPMDTEDFFNFNPQNFYEAPLERTQITALGHYEVAESIEIYGQAFFTDSFVAQQLASSGTFFNNWQFPVGNPFVPEAARQQICAQHGVDPADCVPAVMDADGNVTGGTEEVTIQLRRRMTELGPRLGNFENNMFQWTLGLRGDLAFADGWDWDVYWQRGEADQKRLLGNWGSFSKVQQALRAVAGPTGEPVCLDPSNGCVPLNLFGPEGSITPEMVGFIDLSSIQTQSVSQEVGGASIAGDLGERFRSPWSGLPIGVAAGVEHRRLSAGNLSDGSSQIQDEVLGTGAPLPDRSGRYTLNEIYAETIVPIVTDRPGFRSLALEGGVRHTEFDVADSIDYRSWKGGLSWEPIDSLRFRGSFQRATRSPNVNELFQPLVTGLSNLSVDPCEGNRVNQAEANTPGTLSNLCRETGVPVNVIGVLPSPAAGQINVLTGGNPALGPEVADTLTVGFVWQPELIDDLTLTLDYYDIDLEDAIDGPSSGDIIEDCYSPGRNPNFVFNEACQAVGRSPTGGDLNANDAPGVALPQANLGRFQTSGFDLGVNYGFDLTDIGRLSFSLNATMVEDWTTQPTPQSINRDCLGFYSVSCDGNVYDIKWTQRTTLSTDRYDVSLLWRYLSSLDVEPEVAEDFIPEFSRIGSYNYFDLSGVWRATDDIRVNLTINNLLDKDPPEVGNTIGTTTANSGNTFPQWYDVVGRYFTIGVTTNF
jgi:iron complex outermembrane recepter protein